MPSRRSRCSVRLTVTWVTPRRRARSMTRASPVVVDELGDHLDVVLRRLLRMFLAGAAGVARERGPAHDGIGPKNIPLDKV